MSYPEPIEGESPERLYKQAAFFYDEYERLKIELAMQQKQNRYDLNLMQEGVRLLQARDKTISELEAELARRLRPGTMYQLSAQVDEALRRANEAEDKLFQADKAEGGGWEAVKARWYLFGDEPLSTIVNQALARAEIRRREAKEIADGEYRLRLSWAEKAKKTEAALTAAIAALRKAKRAMDGYTPRDCPHTSPPGMYDTDSQKAVNEFLLQHAETEKT